MSLSEEMHIVYSTLHYSNYLLNIDYKHGFPVVLQIFDQLPMTALQRMLFSGVDQKLQMRLLCNPGRGLQPIRHVDTKF